MVGQEMIYLCRHGSCENGNLSSKGRAEIQDTARRFLEFTQSERGPHVSVIYHGPLPRTVQSAQELQKILGIEIPMQAEECIGNEYIEADHAAFDAFIRAIPAGSLLVTHAQIVKYALQSLCGRDDKTVFPNGGLVAMLREDSTPWRRRLI